MTVGSLFAGIGGFDLGFERAGFEIKWQVEIDDYANRVLEQHWPGVKRLRDIRDAVGYRRDVYGYISAHAMQSLLDPVDVICGGFPCQDISEAGKRAGIDGDRSGLWREMLRIVRELRPRYLLVENVPALLNRGIGRVLGDLADCGLDAEWDVWGVDELGASQHRKRIWILAYPHDAGLQGTVWAGQSRAPREAWAASHSEPLRSTGGFWPPGPGAVADVPRMADGPTDRAHRLRALGNTVSPQIVEWIARRIKEAEG